jgi:GTP cyclohydrolase I
VFRAYNIERATRSLLQELDPDPSRQGLKDTPARVAKAWHYWTSGHSIAPSEVLTSFEDGAEQVDEMIVQREIPFYSHCEHHLAPFFGTVDIAYVPNGRVIGLSKFKRLVDVFALRLQVQERMTQQIAHALDDALRPKGVGVIVRARHLCMESRGVKTAGTFTVTSCLLNALREGDARAEFLNLASNHRSP